MDELMQRNAFILLGEAFSLNSIGGQENVWRGDDGRLGVVGKTAEGGTEESW